MKIPWFLFLTSEANLYITDFEPRFVHQFVFLIYRIGQWVMLQTVLVKEKKKSNPRHNGWWEIGAKDTSLSVVLNYIDYIYHMFEHLWAAENNLICFITVNGSEKYVQSPGHWKSWSFTWNGSGIVCLNSSCDLGR